MSIPFITAEEAASYIKNGDNVAFSGFTASGTPKVVTVALAERAKKLHEEGKPFKINVFTGAFCQCNRHYFWRSEERRVGKECRL